MTATGIGLGFCLAGGVAAGGAAIAVGAAARSTRGRTRLAWGLLAASALGWAIVAITGLAAGELGASPAEIVAIASSVLAASGMALFPGAPPHASGRARTLVDGLIVAASALFIAWTLGLDDLYRANADADSSLALAGAIATLVIASASIVMLTRARPAARPRLTLVAAGFSALAIANAALAYVALGGGAASAEVLYAGWVAGWLLVGVAARRIAGEPEDGELEPGLPTRASVFVPSVPFAAAVLAGAVAQVQGEFGGFLIWNGAIVLVLIVMRQVLALVENISFWRNLQAKVEARTEEVQRSEARFRSLVQNASDVITVIGADATVRYQSPSTRAVFGHAAEGIGPEPPLDLIHEDDRPRVLAMARDLQGKRGGTSSIECRVRHRDGRWRHVEAIVSNRLHDQAVSGFVVNTRDITERKELERQLTHRALHDPLTSLANRALFGDRLEHAARRSWMHGDSIGVLFLDLDDFKTVNDSLGHGPGDELLEAVAGRLMDCVRTGDTVARLGGDEFAILIEGMEDLLEAGRVAERVFAALETPIEIGPRPVFVRASIGIATSTGGRHTAEELLRNADVAMYTAKAQARGSYTMFEPSMHETLVERLDLERDLRDAVAEEQFVLHYQPVVSLKSGSIVAMEALIRWRHPEHGLMPPDRFIPLAEEIGLILAIGHWVLRTACRQAAEWKRQLGRDAEVTMDVNLSARQLQDPALIGDVAGALRESGLDPRSLMLELTEGEIVQGEETITRLEQLRDHGVHLAVDDFGSGYSSLSYLRRLPVDALKIDRKFMQGVETGSQEAKLLGAIVEMSASLGLTPVAEGVETAAQAEQVRRLGCDLAQGFHFARPAEPARATELLESGNPVLSGAAKTSGH